MSSKHRSRSACDVAVRPRMSGAWRSGVAAVAFALLVVACSSGPDNSAGESREETVTVATDEQNDTAASDGIEIRPEDSALVDDEQAVAAAETLVAAYGDTGGAAAFLWGQERGYSVNTLIDAATHGRLSSEGIVTVGGDVVEPEGAAFGVIVLPEGPQGVRRPQGLRSSGDVQQSSPDGGPHEMDALLQQLQISASINGDADDAGLLFVSAIIGLAMSGYTVDQLVEALFLGTAKIGGGKEVEGNNLDCTTLVGETPRDSLPNVVKPNASTGHFCNRQTLEAHEAYSNGLDKATGQATTDEVSSDIGPLEWTGEGVWSSEFVTQFGPATMTITRTPDSDDFSVNAVSSSTSDHEFTTDGFDEVPCTDVTTRTYEGTGTFDDEFPWFILFVGVETVDQEWVDCAIAPAEPLDGTFDRELQVTITETGIEGGYNYGLYTFPGVPIPIAE